MTHKEAIAAVYNVVDNPPAWAVQKGRFGSDEWSPRGFDEWFAPQIHAIEHAVKGHVIGHKTHAYDFEPHCAYGVYINADDGRCEGGCCDDTRAYPWQPYSHIPTYY